MNVDLSAIKAKIRALAAKTVENGCTEHEAMAAIAIVGKLLEQYNLSMTEVELRDEACKSDSIETGVKHAPGVQYAVTSIAKFTDCKVWMNRSRYVGITYTFFGQESDVLMAKYLYELIDGAIVRATVDFKKTDVWKIARSRRGATASFVHGMGNRIGWRLIDMKKQANHDMTEQRGSNALIVLKNQVVEDAWVKMNMKLSKNYAAKTTRNSAAFVAGETAANTVNLSRPVNGVNNPVYALAGK